MCISPTDFTYVPLAMMPVSVEYAFHTISIRYHTLLVTLLLWNRKLGCIEDEILHCAQDDKGGAWFSLPYIGVGVGEDAATCS